MGELQDVFVVDGEVVAPGAPKQIEQVRLPRAIPPVRGQIGLFAEGKVRRVDDLVDTAMPAQGLGQQGVGADVDEQAEIPASWASGAGICWAKSWRAWR